MYSFILICSCISFNRPSFLTYLFPLPANKSCTLSYLFVTAYHSIDCLFLPAYSCSPSTSLCTLSFLFVPAYYLLPTNSRCTLGLRVHFFLPYLHNTLCTENFFRLIYILNLHVSQSVSSFLLLYLLYLFCMSIKDHLDVFSLAPRIVLYLYMGGMLTSIWSFSFQYFRAFSLTQFRNIPSISSLRRSPSDKIRYAACTLFV